MSLTIRKYKTKNTSFIGFLLLVLMFVLFAFNTNNVDMPIYNSIYDIYLRNMEYLSSNIEIGFKLLLKVFSIFNVPFQMLYVFISFVGLLLINKASKHYTKRPYIVLFLFFLFPFFHQVTIIRNFISLFIMFFSLNYLQKKEYIKYIICIIFASLFHQTAIIYLIFLLSRISDRKLNRYIIFVLAMSMVLLLFSPQITIILSSISPKLLFYIGEGTSNITKIVVPINYIIILIICKFMFKNSLIDSKYLDISMMMFKCLKLGVIFVIFSMFSMDFFRLIENIMILFYVILANSNLFRKQKMNVIFLYIMIIIVFQVFAYEILFSYEKIIKMIIDNNLLW